MTVDALAHAMATRVLEIIESGALDRYDPDNTWWAEHFGRRVEPLVPGEYLYDAAYILFAADPRIDTWDGDAKDDARTAYSGMVRDMWTSGEQGMGAVKILVAAHQVLMNEEPYCRSGKTGPLLRGVLEAYSLKVVLPPITQHFQSPAPRNTDRYDVVGQVGRIVVANTKSWNEGRWIGPDPR
jgi:hypothetical protein